MTKTRTPGDPTHISVSPVAPPEITEPSPATLDATEPAEPSSAPSIPTDTTADPNATGPPPERSAAPPFPVVGIGASAGGLAAFEAFFSAIPRDIQTGMAFVLVQHLAPDHKSILTELVKRYTRMQVQEVADGMRLGHALQIKVTAIGIETEVELGAVRDLGCDRAQGFYLGKPMTGDALADWYRRRPSTPGSNPCPPLGSPS